VVARVLHTNTVLTAAFVVYGSLWLHPCRSAEQLTASQSGLLKQPHAGLHTCRRLFITAFL
jgi:hypothetical protein